MVRKYDVNEKNRCVLLYCENGNYHEKELRFGPY